jgi:hypothetical protein
VLLTAVCDGYASNAEPVVNQVVAILLVFIADEAEEVIDDATGGDLNLVEVRGHVHMLADNARAIHSGVEEVAGASLENLNSQIA